ncbi:MAG TPA: imidazoleglycerol-phosphate dehydratase HisB [Syntrophomonadaceae bacterium]|nr:imidazoleglycerol-phosphate dehydratase HisB [Syntrophomonadaceae bacterium]
MSKRAAEVYRETSESEVKVKLNLDGKGESTINTPIPFLNHLLTLFTAHSLCDLNIDATGDMEVDDHHTVEDIGICLGQVLKNAVGDKKGIKRYGEATIPMDESLVRVVLDLSGRAYLAYNLEFKRDVIGNLATENIREFFQALVNNAGMNLHIDLIRGENSHHIAEATFKALARALKTAVSYEAGVTDVWSTKGKL